VMAPLFKSLSGHWILNRAIAGFGKMDGRAIFTPLNPWTLQCREQGEMRLESGSSFSAYRDLFYLLEEDHIAVRSQLPQATETLLFRLRPERTGPGIWPACANDIHYCGRDTYAAEYRFESPDRITIKIDVRGPQKDFVIETLLTQSNRLQRPPDSNSLIG
jgi:hypothetical protein